jgi:hypothetical protein
MDYMYQIQQHDVLVQRYVKSADTQGKIRKEIEQQLGGGKKSKSGKSGKVKGKAKKKREDLIKAAEDQYAAAMGTGKSKASISKTLLMGCVGRILGGGDDAETEEANEKEKE